MPNRVEREIEEILTKLESPAPGRPPVRLRRTWRSRFRGFTRRLPLPRWSPASLNAGSMMLWGIGLILLAFVLNLFASGLTRWVIVAGLILFFGSFIVGFFYRDAGGVGRSRETYWRGQKFDRRDLSGPSPFERLRGWWQGRNRRR